MANVNDSGPNSQELNTIGDVNISGPNSQEVNTGADLINSRSNSQGLNTGADVHILGPNSQELNTSADVNMIPPGDELNRCREGLSNEGAGVNIPGANPQEVNTGADVNISGPNSQELNTSADVNMVHPGDEHNRCREVLSNEGAGMNTPDEYGMTPFMLLVSSYRNNFKLDHTKFVNELIKAGADLNARDNESRTALMFAVQRPQPKIVALLLKAGADMNIKNQTGNTALNCAVYYMSEPCSNILIDAGADVNIANEKGDTPLLTLARLSSNEKFAAALINAGADVNHCNREGQTALMLAAQKRENIVRPLLAAGADVNATDTNGGNALLLGSKYTKSGRLHYSYSISYMNRYPSLIKKLLKAGIHINKVDKERSLNALGLLINFKFQNEVVKMSTQNIRLNFEPATITLYAAGETLEGTDVKKIPEELKFEEEKLQLKHVCREAIRKHLLKLDPHQHLFGRIPELGLPSIVTEYLLFNQSLDDDDSDDDGN